MTTSFQHYVDGTYQPSESGRRFDSIDPARGQTWATVADGTAADVDLAVNAALRGLAGEWSKMDPSARGRLIHKLGDLIAADAERLAELETADNGRLLRDTIAQARYVPEWFYYYAGLADKSGGEVIPTQPDEVFVYTRRVPVGVVGMIVPWNAPLILLALKLPAALAAGCTVVVKPSEYASTAVTALGSLFENAGFPPGIFNVVNGQGPEVGAALVAHPGVSQVAFTGSTATGRLVAAAAGAGLKRTTLELGGKSAQIVFADADLDAAASGIIAGGFTSAGQSCYAGTRILVHEDVYEVLREKLVDLAASIRLGDPRDPSSEIGPIANKIQFLRVHEYLRAAVASGATVDYGEGPDESDGFFIRPTILSDVARSSPADREEIFGPVINLHKFQTDDEALAIANDSEYGLAAGVWTSDLRRAHLVANALHVGTVWINTYRVVSPKVPFGGMKDSGVGRENGAAAIAEFSEIKSVWVDLTGAVRPPFGRPSAK
jgi:(Z)-2-((N-methylformamido)methylene)-5-hydroxybutyrolactone dehydrogenase